jgi:voltage-gated potassium channel
VIREELGRLLTWEERHRRLIARIGIALALTLAFDVAGAILTFFFERHAHGTDIHSFGDAFFFSTVQLLTVSSQITNPLTSGGRIVDVGLQAWAVIVVASIGGSFAAFFLSGDN